MESRKNGRDDLICKAELETQTDQVFEVYINQRGQVMQKTICHARMSAGMGVNTEVWGSTGKKGLNPVWKGSGKICQKQ